MSTGTTPRTGVRRGLRRLGVIGALAVAAVAMTAGTALANVSGTVHTDSGLPLNVHSGPSTSSSVTGTVANGGAISIDCQTYGDTVTGKYGTSNIWDHFSGGYVTDTYVYTGTDGLVAPLCGGVVCQNSFGNPRSCADAVSWAISHESTSYHSDYDHLCDHVVGEAYGWSASGSTSAYVHWTQIPSAYRYPGSSSVPAGGLAFFSSSSGSGHVMISIGGGKFVSNDIHGVGTLTETTISEIKSTWGETYLGWAQPWFKVNH